MAADLNSAGISNMATAIELEVEKIGILRNKVERQDA